jgi:hypothetical protein
MLPALGASISSRDNCTSQLYVAIMNYPRLLTCRRKGLFSSQFWRFQSITRWLHFGGPLGGVQMGNDGELKADKNTYIMIQEKRRKEEEGARISQFPQSLVTQGPL